MNNSTKISVSNELLHDIFQRILSGEISILFEEDNVKYKTFVHEDSRVYDLPELTYVAGDKIMSTFYFGFGNPKGNLYNSISPTIVKEEVKCGQ